MADEVSTQAGGPSELVRSVVGNKYVQWLTNKQASPNSLRGRVHSSHLTVGWTASCSRCDRPVILVTASSWEWDGWILPRLVLCDFTPVGLWKSMHSLIWRVGSLNSIAHTPCTGCFALALPHFMRWGVCRVFKLALGNEIPLQNSFLA